MSAAYEGACLCGAVRYRHAGPLREVIGCHCNQCRRTSGHFVAATWCTPPPILTHSEPPGFAGSRRSSQAMAVALGKSCNAELANPGGLPSGEALWGHLRGFCGQCGSSLFWTRENSGRISIMAGTLAGPTGLRLARHIHVADGGDYYRIDPDLPCAEQGDVLPDIPAANTQQEES